MLPTSRLEAVNEMLSCVGEAPVNRLKTGYIESDIAENILDSVSRDTQSGGWNFNTEDNWELTPDLNKNLILPLNTLKVDGVTQDQQYNWVMRGNKLYNKITQSYLAEAPVKVTLIMLLDFEVLPEAARRYITLKSGRLMQDRTMGLGNLHEFNLYDEQMALIELKDMDAEVNDYSIFDSFDTYQIINRSGGNVR
jgi:hypothetical protein